LTSGNFEVAFVCTGNRFRSPLAAALFAAETEDLPVRIESLGILELGSAPALPEAVEAGRAFGVDLSAHRTRDLAQLDLADFDLVLGFEQLHVRSAVGAGRAPAERTFILPELGALLEVLPTSPSLPDPVERARARVQEAGRLRAQAGRNATVHDIPDPLGRPASVQRQTAEEIRALVSTVAPLLFS
jgi:protein-tyrosine phosphatase